MKRVVVISGTRRRELVLQQWNAKILPELKALARSRDEVLLLVGDEPEGIDGRCAKWLDVHRPDWDVLPLRAPWKFAKLRGGPLRNRWLALCALEAANWFDVETVELLAFPDASKKTKSGTRDTIRAFRAAGATIKVIEL